MSTKSRSDRIQQLVKIVAKHFKPVLAPRDRSLFEHLIYASVLEDASYEAADEAFHKLQDAFFDWNEVRVTTVTELVEHLQQLPDPKSAAMRVKKNLQSIFEARYNFELDDLLKGNQGKALGELEKLAGMTRFILGYVTQNALGGHAIPVSDSIMLILVATGIVTDAEAAKGQTPGLDRTVPKSKGPEFSSGLHQLALLVTQTPKGKQTKAILQELGISDIKKPAPVEPKEAAPPAKPAGKVTAPAKTPAESSTAKKTPPKKTAPDKKPSGSKKAGAPKKPAAKKPAEKSASKQAPTKKTSVKKTVAKKLPEKPMSPKRKPR